MALMYSLSHSFHELHFSLWTYTQTSHTHYAAHSKSSFGKKKTFFWGALSLSQILIILNQPNLTICI